MAEIIPEDSAELAVVVCTTDVSEEDRKIGPAGSDIPEVPEVAEVPEAAGVSEDKEFDITEESVTVV